MIRELQGRVQAQEEVLREMVDSRAFAIAERISRLYQRGKPTLSRDAIVRVLGGGKDS